MCEAFRFTASLCCIRQRGGALRIFRRPPSYDLDAAAATEEAASLTLFGGNTRGKRAATSRTLVLQHLFMQTFSAALVFFLIKPVLLYTTSAVEPSTHLARILSGTD